MSIQHSVSWILKKRTNQCVCLALLWICILIVIIYFRLFGTCPCTAGSIWKSELNLMSYAHFLKCLFVAVVYLCIMFFLHLQHVDGSFSVKPLKQKQIVSLNFHIVLFVALLYQVPSRDGNVFIIFFPPKYLLVYHRWTVSVTCYRRYMELRTRTIKRQRWKDDYWRSLHFLYIYIGLCNNGKSHCDFSPQPSDDENSDNSNECVVCLSDLRDTLILPCRHLCLCNSCADTLRYQANNCPICRLRM